MMEERKVPALRFQGFTDEWEENMLGEMTVFSKGSGYSKSDLQDHGTPIVLYGRLYTNYEILISHIDTFVEPKQGAVYSQGVEVIVPASGETAEDISRASVIGRKGVIIGGDLNILYPNKLLDPVFLAITISNGKAHEDMAKRAQGKTVVHLHNDDLAQIKLFYPSISELKQIGVFFQKIDVDILLLKNKLDKLQVFKKSMLEKMFPRPGEKVPEVRFRGFMGGWEKRRFGELVDIERGGSPRPIDEYITDDYDGLNWVKIGDAPSQGRYIMHTGEKIKASGLSKTRQVFPGDLILSNSMSFGKPYIMGISGCIHDGWLLIRNSRNLFNLKFLCQMLGTEHMLSQYKSLAAGSTVNNLNKELVSNVIVNVPPLEEQVRIGAFLENIDDIISCCQRKLEKLQSMKQAMLSEMFI